MSDSGATMHSAWPLYRALVGVGLVCAIVLATVHELTRPAIEANRAARLRSAIGEVLPGSVAVRSYRVGPSGALEAVDAATGGEGIVYAGLDADGRLLGLAFEGLGPGYQDAIKVLLGYDPKTQLTTGLAVLASRETPGLGDRIRSATFREQFRGLDARLDASGSRLSNAVSVARAGQPALGWQLDGISGATVSSRAVARIVSDALNRWAPLLRARHAGLDGDAR